MNQLRILALGAFLMVIGTTLKAQGSFKAGEYRDGVAALYNHLGTSLMFTEEAAALKRSGVAYSAVSVDENGNIDSVWMVKPFDPSTSENILQTLRTMKGFKPSKFDNEPVSAVYTFSVVFKNAEDTESNTTPDYSVFNDLRRAHSYVAKLDPMYLTAKNTAPQFRVKNPRNK